MPLLRKQIITSHDKEGAGGPHRRENPRLSRNAIALSFVSLFNDTASEMIAPLLPAFIAALGGGPQALGLIEGVADATASLVQIASGYMADWVGYFKRLALAGYGFANLLRPLLSIAGNWPQVLAIRFGDRVGKGVRGPARDTLLVAELPSDLHGYAFGLNRAMDHAGAVVGPSIAWLMLRRQISLRSIFAWSAIPGVLCLALLAAAVREHRGADSAARPEIAMPPSAAYRRLLAAVFIFSLGCSSDAFLLWRAGELGIPMQFATQRWIVLHVVKSASSTWGGALSDKAGRRLPILAGWGLYAAVYIGFAFAHSAWQVWVLFAVYGAFFGLTESAQKAFVVDLVAEEWRGRALGVYSAAIGVAELPASVVFGVVYQHAGAAAAFSMGAALALIAAAVLPQDPAGEAAVKS
jgi:MFS family permease